MTAQKSVEMLVSLKIPDATALSALQALHEMGFKDLKQLERVPYYKFFIEGDERKFRERIAKADIIVNSNKHSASFGIPKDGKKVSILVENREQGDSLAKTLRDRLGFSGLKGVKSGVLWMFSIEGSNAEDRAKEMAEKLLFNPHYQQYRVM